jgi:hypothetical protein
LDDSHDPLQIVKQLRQTLAADKLSVGFFVGAGCPCAIRVADGLGKDRPIIPDVAGLTKLVRERLESSVQHKAPFATLIKAMEDDGQQEPNIEDVLNRIRGLRDVAGRGDVRGLSFQDLDQLDKEISKVIGETVDRSLPNNATPYHALARFVGSHRFPPSEIFTPNYDLLMEQALEAHRVPYFDGFVGSALPFFDQRAIEEDALPIRWSRLWKLHGSLNWRFNKETRSVVRSRNKEDGDELLIHPSHRKYDESRRMPYFVMIDRLRAFLRNERQPVALIVIGYSFSDEHLNAAIIESLKANPSAACFALQYDEMVKYPNAKTLATDNSNLSVLARDAGVMRRREGNWLARPGTDVDSLREAFEVIKTPVLTGTAPSTVDEDQSDTPRPCRLRIGDFQHLGTFLDDVSRYGGARATLS